MADITAKELVTIGIEIGRPTTDWPFGRALLEAFAQQDPRLVPQSLHIWDSPVGAFTSPEDAQPHWATLGQMRAGGSLSEFHVGLAWRRKLTTRYQAEIQHESRDTRGRLNAATLSVYAKPHKAIDWRAFAHTLYALTEAPYGFVHLHRDAHLSGVRSEAREPSWITAYRREASVPELGWSTFLGAPYANAIPDALMQLGPETVQTIGAGVAITLSDSLLDVSDAYGRFQERRAAVKALFPEGFFEIPKRPGFGA